MYFRGIEFIHTGTLPLIRALYLSHRSFKPPLVNERDGRIWDNDGM